jgi:hypothetical protein
MALLGLVGGTPKPQPKPKTTPVPTPRVWTEEPTGFHGVPFGSKYSKTLLCSKHYNQADAAFDCPEDFDVVGVKVHALYLLDAEWKVLGVEFKSPEQDWPQMKAAFIAAYGEPTRVFRFDNGLGGEHLQWSGKKANLAVEESMFDPQGSVSFGTFMLNDAYERAEAARQRKAKGAVDSLR